MNSLTRLYLKPNDQFYILQRSLIKLQHFHNFDQKIFEEINIIDIVSYYLYMEHCQEKRKFLGILERSEKVLKSLEFEKEQKSKQINSLIDKLNRLNVLHDPNQIPFFFGHFDECVVCNIVLVNNRTKNMICMKNVQIDPGFYGGILIHRKIANFLDTEVDFPAKLETGNMEALWGSYHQSSLSNAIWIMGRENHIIDSKISLIQRKISTGIFVPDVNENSDLVLIGLEFLEYLHVSMITKRKCCVLGYYPQEKKKTLFEFDENYGDFIGKGKNEYEIRNCEEEEISSEKVMEMFKKKCCVLGYYPQEKKKTLFEFDEKYGDLIGEGKNEFEIRNFEEEEEKTSKTVMKMFKKK